MFHCQLSNDSMFIDPVWHTGRYAQTGDVRYVTRAWTYYYNVYKRTMAMLPNVTVLHLREVFLQRRRCTMKFNSPNSLFAKALHPQMQWGRCKCDVIVA